MGLDTTHNCWHGGYGLFMAWRRRLAEVAGLPPLGLMDGFWMPPDDPMTGSDESLALRIVALKLDAVAKCDLRRAVAGLPIRWEWLKPDPLHVLLRHSDCDGEIAPDDCAAIADRLEQLLPLLESVCPAGRHEDVTTRKFVAGLRLAAGNGEPVRFG